VHQLFIATSLQFLLPVIQTICFSVPRFSIRRKKNLQKLNIIFLDQTAKISHCRNYQLYGNESFQMLQLLNTHLVNFKFVLRNYFFTVFAIYFVDRKYEVNSWIDIGINFDIFRMYICMMIFTC
jgi:type IV secretory pathway VirB3-like protein